MRRPNFNPLTVLPREAALLLDSKYAFVTSGRRGAIFRAISTEDAALQVLRPLYPPDSSTARDATGETGSGAGVEAVELDENGTGSGSGSGTGIGLGTSAARGPTLELTDPSRAVGGANKESTPTSSRSSLAAGFGHMVVRLMRRTWGSSSRHTSASDEGSAEAGGGEPGPSQRSPSDTLSSNANARIPRTVSLDPTPAMLAASRYSRDLGDVSSVIASSGAQAGEGGAAGRNVMMQAARFELQRIFGLARRMQLLLLECESVNFAQQLVKCPLEPLVVYLRVPSSKVLTRLIKFSSTGALHAADYEYKEKYSVMYFFKYNNKFCSTLLKYFLFELRARLYSIYFILVHATEISCII